MDEETRTVGFTGASEAVTHQGIELIALLVWHEEPRRMASLGAGELCERIGGCEIPKTTPGQGAPKSAQPTDLTGGADGSLEGPVSY
jgi:hypothetical protein